MPENDRHQQRLPVQSRVFIELEAAAVGSPEDASLAICKTLDVSSGGIQVALNQELTVDAFLQIGVETPHSEGETDTFFLTGQVCWCRPGPDKEYPWTAGLMLLRAEHSDIDHWEALIDQLAD